MVSKSLKVFFDTNIFIDLFDQKNDDKIKCIYKKIEDKTIDPYISETIFTIEEIPRNNRKNVLSRQKVETKSDIKSIGDRVKLSLTIVPGKESHVNLAEHQIRRLKEAKQLGFKIIPIPRIAGFNNQELRELFKEMIIDNTETENERIGECARYIENELFAGKHVIDEFLKKRYGGETFFENIEKLKNDPEVTAKKIAKLMAEWADGDSVAAAVGYEIGFFCTNDNAKGSGSESIFSESKRNKIEEKYNIKIVSSKELVSIIKNKE